ncbi:MAG: hypothetical protein KA264_01765 [Crocinitomicaceae bacterium]|nr:hypothetical protein [Crocinitomicaceae bacterium]
MRSFKIIVVFFLVVFNSYTQEYKPILKESYVDSITYALSYQGKHKELVIIANNAWNNDIDFYYLRLRVGISYFNKKQYLMALTHFNKALEFYPSDFTTKEYIFYCNLYLGDTDRAKEIVSKMPINYQVKYLDLLKSNNIINLESGYQFPIYSNKQDTSTFLANGIFSETDRTKSLQYYQLGADFKLTNKVKLYAGFSLVNNLKSQQIYSKDNYYYYDYTTFIFNKSIKTKDTSIEYNLYQYQAYIGATINLPKQFSLQIGYQDMYYKQSKLFTKSDSSKSILLDTIVYNYKYRLQNINQNNFVTSLTLTKNYKSWQGQIGLGFANIVKTSIVQMGGQFTYFPLGNYNLSLTAGYYLSKDTLSRNIGQLKIAGRISDNLWFESYYYQGNLKNFQESNSYVVYNVSDIITSKSGISLIYYLSQKLSVGVRYDLLVRKAEFDRYVVLNNRTTKSINTDKYNMNSFIINMIWKY